MSASDPVMSIESIGAWGLFEEKLVNLGLTDILSELKDVVTSNYVFCLASAQCPAFVRWVLTAEPRDEVNPNVYKPFMVGQDIPHGAAEQ